ncbi:unnamed protein product [Allacma fusca]|uniref:Enoyl reductase (ER) domain-containing protein n=1 Tax=Allacma fusca TaxID=39272 RepID=A0A8J2NQQ7_9HEXA|nr:unnamed protein product [Allacma fusca]
MNDTGAKKVVKDNLDVAVVQCSNALESIQAWSQLMFQSLQNKLNSLYDAGVVGIENLDLNGKLGHVWLRVGDSCHEAIELLRSQVSTQAIYFGVAGLVTGSVIGLCIGYSVKKNSSQAFSTSFSNSLMRAILTTNTNRRIDGITTATTTIPNLLHPDNVLIHVKAMSVDNIDVKIASGYKNVYRYQLGLSSARAPFVLGRECSGIIVDIGHQVYNFEINDRVWVCLPIWASRGVMSEYIVVPEKYVGQKPKNISFEGAATIPYAALMLWRKVIQEAHLDSNNTKNKRILIHLGSVSKNDGVGLLATQVLKSWGARVTISTTEHVEDNFPTGYGVAQLTFLHSLKSLGAESHLILPNDKSLLPNVAQRIFDVVINTDCGDITPHLECFCKDPSKAQVLETFPPEFTNTPATIFHSLMGLLFTKQKPDEESSHYILDECRRLIESGLVAPVVAKSFLKLKPAVK